MREERVEAPAQLAGAAADHPLGPAERFGEPRVVERFHEVVQRVHVERTDREFVVRGDEDDGGPPRRVEPPQHLEPVQLGHLHVEEHEVGPEPLDRFQRGASIGTLCHHLEVRILPHQVGDPGARQRLVVDHHDRERCAHAGTGAAARGRVRYGSVIVARAPPDGPGERSRVCSAP